MANSLNKVQLIGNVGNDSEVRTVNDRKVASFRLATSYGSGENERTNWHNIVCWDQRAEVAEKYVRKGMKLYIEGQVTYRTYEGKDGAKHEITEIFASNILLLSSAQEGQRRAPAQRTYNTQAEILPTRDNDLPF